MKKSNLILLSAILVVLIGIAYLAINQQSSSTIDKEKADFSVEDTATISSIFLADRSGNEVKLVRKSSDQWYVNDEYPANESRIKTLLTTIKKVEVKNPVPLTARKNVVKNMATNHVKIEIFKDGNLHKSYFVGGTTPDELGTYMAMNPKEPGLFGELLHTIGLKEREATKEPFVTHIPGFEGFLSSRYFANIKDWRTQELFPFNPMAIDKVQMKYPNNQEKSFQIKVEGNNQFQVTGMSNQRKVKSPSKPAIKTFLMEFDQLNFVRTLNKTSDRVMDSLQNVTPMVKIDVKVKDHKPRKLKLYPISREPISSEVPAEELEIEKYYGIANTRDQVLIIQSRILDKILRNLKDFESLK